PLPGDIAVVFGGYLAGRGRLGFAEVLIATTAGSWCGFMSYFLLGRWLGRTGVHQRIGALLGAARLEQGEAWVRRHGYGVVLANRLLPGRARWWGWSPGSA
ncbi:MAG: hypothetical protein GWO03_14945, partial [Gammaproteobacteria bacterium]|nr:hypothetical protein [Gammaproteobacteria bacterium]